MLHKGRHHEIAWTNFVELQPLKTFENPGTHSHDALGAASPNGVLVFSTRLGGCVVRFTTDSTWPQIADKTIPLLPTLTNGKSDLPVIRLAGDGLLRSNVYRLSFQPSLTTMPIGQFHELALL